MRRGDICGSRKCEKSIKKKRIEFLSASYV